MNYIFNFINIMELFYWGLGIWPNPQSPIPNPQSPIPTIINHNVINFKIKKITKQNQKFKN